MLRPWRALLLSLCLVWPACGPEGGDPQDAAVEPDGEVSDAGPRPDAAPLPDRFVPDAYVPVCGNGTVDPDEACDDGNAVNGDGCNRTCTRMDDVDGVAATFTDGDQLAPRLAVAGTNAVMIWSDHGGIDIDGAGVRMRFFGEDGEPAENVYMGTFFDVPANSVNAGDQVEPAVAGHTDGRFVVVWTDHSGTSGGGVDVRAQFFNGDGSRIHNPFTGTSDFVVNTTPTGTQQEPAVAISSTGLVLITWSDDSATGADTSGWAVRGRLFDLDANPQVNTETASSEDFVVNLTTAGNQRRSAVSATGATGWAVTWVDDSGLDGSGTSISGTLLSTLGAHLLASDAVLNTTTTGNQDHPAVALQPGQGLVVAWTDDSRGAADPFFKGVRARVFDLTGAPRANGVTLDTNDFPVNTTVDGSQQKPAVAVSGATGDVVFLWQDGSASDGSFAGIRARVFSPSLTPLATTYDAGGEDFLVNEVTAQGQFAPTAAVLGGQVLAAWEDHSQAPPDVSGAAIRYRFLLPLW